MVRSRRLFPPTSGAGSIQSPSRRRFVTGMVGGGIMAGLWPGIAAAGNRPGVTGHAPELRGQEIHLVVEELPANFTGRSRMAVAINGSIPAPTLRWREGDEVVIHVTNRLHEPTSIHWHGIILPWQMDGVPGISFSGILPGETFTYRFTIQQHGTYWYHSHSGFQEMKGMYGAIIIDPRNGPDVEVDRDYTLLLSEWTDADPLQVFARLKAKSHLYNFNQPTVADFLRDANRDGLAAAMSKREMFATMRMNPTDLGDLSAATLTYLINGLTPADNWMQLFAAGERVRLRLINGAGNTFFDFRIPGLPLQVIQADGMPVHPVTVDEMRIAPGETYDVVVEPVADAYTLFAETMDRSGFAVGTLAVREGLRAALPARRPAQWLTMTDMMGAMAAPNGRHATSEFGPSVDMRVDSARTNLDDPGVGLRDSGHRVLTLDQLRSHHPLPDQRPPQREIELHLTGNMERYSWSIDGLEYGDSTPILFHLGERLRVILHNDTMMSHPMHLHGMWSDLEDDRGNLLSRRHTLTVQPAQRISFRVTADAPGRWAWHCHLLFHMDAGMFREVVVA